LTNADLLRLVEGETVATGFLRTARAHGSRAALRWKDPSGAWQAWTFAEYADRVARAAAGLAARGIGRGDRIVLMMRNCPDFHVVDMAAYFVGATAISIYNSSSSEQVEYLVNHCEAQLALVEDGAFLARFLPIRRRLVHLASIGVVADADAKKDADVFSWGSLLDHSPIDLERAAKIAQPDDLATVIYTSGTTGPPKGVMLTHKNIAWTVESLRRAIGLEDFVGKKIISYLPMAHIAERVMSHYQQAFLGLEVTTCPEAARIGDYAREVRPNLMFGVPRVWEKIHAGLSAALAVDAEKARKFAEAIEAARPIVDALAWERATQEQKSTYAFLDQIAFRTVRQLVGLDQLDLAMTGAAPIPREMIEWFRAVGVPLAEIYGMSECSGPMTFTARKVKPGTVR
jgi:long-chain acyl-CoA synthetase